MFQNCSIWGKMMRVSIIGLFSLICVAFATEKVRFDDCKVFKVTPRNQYQLDSLRQLESFGNGYNFWTDIGNINKSVHIMVPPYMKHDFNDFLKLTNMEGEIYIENVQKLIDTENSKPRSTKFGWAGYYRLDEIYAWLEEIVNQHPDILTLVEGGQTYEGRKIMGVKLSYSPDNAKRGVFLEGGIHAREWIAPATITYMLNQFLTSTDPDIRQIAESNDWYIFPVVNPDGYEYTHTTNRYWRKTRQPHGICVGADPNRNWGYQWMDGGASNNPCSETYAGTAAFSETETRTLAAYITSVSENLYAYIGFHSFSQLLLIPYGHSGHEVPENYDQLMEIGMKAKESLAKRYGTQYTVGNIVDVIYVASGGSMDWVEALYKTPITYTYELRDTGRYGFDLPAEQIVPTAEETLDSLVTILQEAAKRKL